MVLVPRAKHQAGTVAPGPVVGVQAAQTGVGQLAQGLSDAGTAFENFQDERDTAAAKAADTQFSDEVRRILYEDGTGFMQRVGGNAVDEHQNVEKLLKESQEKVLQGLSGQAREKARLSIDGRYQSALQKVDTHYTGQHRTYLNDTANARVKAAVSDAIFDPAKVQESIKLVVQEAVDAGARNGSSEEVIKGQIVAAQTEIHSGIIKRIAAQSPVEAMRYLQDNKSKMDGEEVARLSGALMPKVKEFKGRQAGKAAFNSGQDLVRGLVTRGLPQHVAEAFVINFQDESGLNPGINEANPIVPGSRGGFGLYQLTGPRRREYEKFAAERGVPVSDVDAQLDFLMHELGGKEAAAAQAIMAAGSREQAAVAIVNKFLRPSEKHRASRAEKYARGATGGLKELLKIEDPDERDAAIREFKLLDGVAQSEASAARESAANAAFELIESGGNVDDLPIDFRQSLGIEEMSSLRTYQDKLASGEKIETDPEQYVLLSNIASQNPQGFSKLNPIAWRDKLNDGDFKKFVDLQRTIKNEGREAAEKKTVVADAPTISALRTASSTALKAAGILPADDPKAAAAFETELVKWADLFTSKNETKPSPLDISQKVSQMLTPVSIDPKGFWNKRNRSQDGAAFQMDYEGQPLDPDDDMTLEDIRGASITINGTDVEQDVLGRFVSGFADAMGRNPTAEEVVNGLIESGVY